MGYLIFQIIICLLIAFLLGLLIGWWLRGIGCKKRCKELEADLAAARSKSMTTKVEKSSAKRAAPKPSAPKPAGKDNLKEILGVGPVLEKMLHKNGVTTFKQISKLSSSDIETLSTKLGSFKDRIVRDDWVGKAKELHQKKYG